MPGCGFRCRVRISPVTNLDQSQSVEMRVMSLHAGQFGSPDRKQSSPRSGRALHCLCCGQLFERSSGKGPQPYYCSGDCRRQMAVRRRAWAGQITFSARAAASQPVQVPSIPGE